jgi:hypothetical protein
MKKRPSPERRLIKMLLTVLLLGTSYCYAQVTQPRNFLDWSANTGSQDFFQKNISKTDASGNVYVCGATVNGNGDYDLLVAKYNSSGVQQWINQYAGAAAGNDFATAVWIDGSSNVYVTGSTLNATADSNDVVTIKYNSSGIQQWAVLYNGGYGNDGGSDITVDGSGNVYISGTTNTGTSTYFDGLLIKYNSSGTQQYVKTFDNANLNDGAYRVAVLTSNRVAIACIVQATATTFKFASVRYTATTGAFIASTISASSSIGFKMVTGCVTDAAHNMYVTGWEYNLSTGYDYRTIKLDSALTQIWSASFDGASSLDDQSNGIAMDGSGNVYVTGYSTSVNGKDYATIKYNSSGVQQWVEYYNDADDSDDVANAIVLDNNGLPVVTGYHYNGSSKDYHTIKYDASGTIIWSSDYNGLDNEDDRAFDIACDTNNDIIVTGQTQMADLTLEYTTVKYIQKNTILPQDTITYMSNSFGYTENRGQVWGSDSTIHPEVKYYTMNEYPNMYFTDTAVSYVFAKLDTSNYDTLIRVDMKFINANSNLKIRSLSERKDYCNFFLDDIPEGRSRVQNYNDLISFNVWNNVDMVYGNNLKGFKYYFICKPVGGGGSAYQIDLQYSGADSVRIDGLGQLIIYTPLGNIIQPKAAAWEIDGSGNFYGLGWQPSYNIIGTNEVAFTSLGSYNTAHVLVIAVDFGGIQPQINGGNQNWGTFFGMGATLNDNVINNSGQFFTCGETWSSMFPVQFAYYGTQFGGRDAIVAKFDTDHSLLWSTYYGGALAANGQTTALDVATGIDLDVNGNVFVTGSTQSIQLPHFVWGSAYDQTLPGNSTITTEDAFILRMSDDGQTIYWSTWYGGVDEDRAHDIKVCKNTGEIYIVGSASYGTPLLNAAAWSAGGGFIAKFDAQGAPVWSTQIGNGVEYFANGSVNALAIDANNNIVVVGQTITGTDFPIVNPGGNSSYAGGSYDGFVAKLSGTTSSPTIIWSTYYGGGDEDNVNNIVTAKIGGQIKYFIVGITKSSSANITIPVVDQGTGNYYVNDLTSPGYWDAFIAKFNIGGAIDWSTYFGGSNDELAPFGSNSCVDIATDGQGDVLVTLGTISSDIPLPSPNLFGAYQQAYNGSFDAFIAAFRTGTEEYFWGTYFGGQSGETVNSIECYNNAEVYISGSSSNYYGNFPLEAGNGIPYYDAGGIYQQGFIASFGLAPIIAGINVIHDEDLSLSIYPNPAENSIWIDVQMNSTEEITIDMINTLGEIVEHEALYPAIIIHHTLDLSNYSNGVYFVKVQSGNKIITQKIVVQR